MDDERAIEEERELQMKTEIYDRIKDGTPFTRQLLKEAVRIGVDLTNINTSEITDMSELFIHSNEIIGVITHWDTSKVTAMNGTFRRAKISTNHWSGTRRKSGLCQICSGLPHISTNPWASIRRR